MESYLKIEWIRRNTNNSGEAIKIYPLSVSVTKVAILVIMPTRRKPMDEGSGLHQRQPFHTFIPVLGGESETCWASWTFSLLMCFQENSCSRTHLTERTGQPLTQDALARLGIISMFPPSGGRVTLTPLCSSVGWALPGRGLGRKANLGRQQGILFHGRLL